MKSFLILALSIGLAVGTAAASEAPGFNSETSQARRCELAKGPTLSPVRKCRYGRAVSLYANRTWAIRCPQSMLSDITVQIFARNS